jgi:hypothetical protein
MAERGSIDASIPLQGQRPNVMGRMSDLLNMQRQSIAVKADQTALEGAQQTQRQRKGLADFDVQPFIGEDGTLDLNKLATDESLRKAAGDQYPEVLQQYAGVRQQQLAAQSALVKLRGEERNAFGEMIGALRSDKRVAEDTPEGRQIVADAASQFLGMYPNSEAVLRAYAAPIVNAPKGKLPQVLQNIQLGTVAAAQQAASQAPQYADTGAELKQTNPYAQAGQAPSTIPLTLSPGERFPLTTNAAGQIVRADRAAGTVAPVTGANPTAAQAEAQASNVPRMQTTINEAAGAPQVRNVLQNIIRLADDVQTGPKSEQVNRIKAMVGNVIPGATGWQDSSSAYQEMTKYMEQLALRSWAAAGGTGTNTQLDAQIRANPNNEYNSQTVKELAKWVMAGEDAKLAKARSMATWLKKEGNSVNNIEDFELQWANAMDPRVFQWKGMTKEEGTKKFSKEERTDIRKSYLKLQALGVE